MSEFHALIVEIDRVGQPSTFNVLSNSSPGTYLCEADLGKRRSGAILIEFPQITSAHLKRKIGPTTFEIEFSSGASAWAVDDAVKLFLESPLAKRSRFIQEYLKLEEICETLLIARPLYRPFNRWMTKVVGDPLQRKVWVNFSKEPMNGEVSLCYKRGKTVSSSQFTNDEELKMAVELALKECKKIP